eukprot:11747102-Alexandrium_andersonii.AAC.1
MNSISRSGGKQGHSAQVQGWTKSFCLPGLRSAIPGWEPAPRPVCTNAHLIVDQGAPVHGLAEANRLAFGCLRKMLKVVKG